ncbi:helix-turn-helix transcriptional regulator [Parvibacter caecicola]|uniref:DNA-binding CsgD family transcriptional regulator n=1 Tax=Parvibacter caecicola TaxID=747645 RepID=A0A7W5D1D7_9ACTN|nr:helix-turn-helix transcriptional regulator [Parvibacter caecicola]MBB3170900.1 DNA-binding CsgD family transcriptional regulator [Parvibacter caecicola]MCR2042360.1 helix-turn-helix transcriptional regulator [Parvibacter caecicola]RNL09103.1 hypothetical protein DMP11_09675 [Parvibacter caecicola]
MDAVKGFRPELLLFAAFFATIPFFSPNYTVFHAVSDLSDVAVGPFAQAALVAGAVAGVAVTVAAARGRAQVLESPPVMTVSAVLYVVGYGALCAGLLAEVPVALVVAAAVATAAGSAGGAVVSDSDAVEASGPRGTAVGEPPAPPDSIDNLSRRQGEPLFRLFGRMGTVLFVPFVGLLMFAFITGVRKFMLFDVVYMEDLGIVLGAMAAIPLSLVKTRRPLLPFVYQVVLPLFALVLVVLNSFPQSTPPLWLAAWVSYGFFGLIAILALASLCAMAHAGEFSVALIYGATVAGFCLVSLLGMFCGTLPPFAVHNGGPALLVVSTLYFAFLIAMALNAGWQVQERAAAMEAPTAEGERGGLAARCRQHAEACGLSPREGEIFMYLARGHTPAFIAKTLVISESTVRTHAKSIYRKLGVSSREQLMQLVDRS